MQGQFSDTTYVIRKKVLTLAGAAFHVYDANENVVLYSRQKAFKLKEDIRLYTGEDMQTELLCIKARSALDISAAYDVVDTVNSQMVGTLKRQGFKSMLRDSWLIMDGTDCQIGEIKEDNMAMALVRRFLTNLFPQKYTAALHGRSVCEYKQNFNPFVHKITLDLSLDTQGVFDRRLALAAGILLCAIEGRQE